LVLRFPIAALLFPVIGIFGPLIIIALGELDGLAPARKLRAWAWLATVFAMCIFGIAYACVHHFVTTVHGAGMLFIGNDGVLLVRAPSTGRLVSARVKQGDRVAPGDEIGRFSQDDLVGAIREAESTLASLRREDRELSEFKNRGGVDKGATITPSQQATPDSPHGALARSKTAERERGLRREKIDANDSGRKFQSERRLKITELETKLALDRDRLDRTSRIVSPTAAVVDRLLVGLHQQVHDGAPVVVLHGPNKRRRGTEDSKSPYDAIILVPADECRWVGLDNDVEVVPVTISRELHGFIRGRVVGIDQHPATKLTVEEALWHPAAADALLKGFAGKALPRVIKVKMFEAGPEEAKHTISLGGNRFEWSSSSGRMHNLGTATICQAKIVIERRRLIHLIAPWSRRVLGR
jgi:biotin carboxyl carrier protein